MYWVILSEDMMLKTREKIVEMYLITIAMTLKIAQRMMSQAVKDI